MLVGQAQSGRCRCQAVLTGVKWRGSEDCELPRECRSTNIVYTVCIVEPRDSGGLSTLRDGAVGLEPRPSCCLDSECNGGVH